MQLDVWLLLLLRFNCQYRLAGARICGAAKPPDFERVSRTRWSEWICPRVFV